MNKMKVLNQSKKVNNIVFMHEEGSKVQGSQSLRAIHHNVALENTGRLSPREPLAMSKSKANVSINQP